MFRTERSTARSYHLLSIIAAATLHTDSSCLTVSIIDLGDGKYSGGGMTLQLMPDKGLSGMGAVCLDGSDAGFYFSPSTGGDKFKNSWQLYFQGGGWCVDESALRTRAAAPPRCPAPPFHAL